MTTICRPLPHCQMVGYDPESCRTQCRAFAGYLPEHREGGRDRAVQFQPWAPAFHAFGRAAVIALIIDDIGKSRASRHAPVGPAGHDGILAKCCGDLVAMRDTPQCDAGPVPCHLDRPRCRNGRREDQHRQRTAAPAPAFGRTPGGTGQRQEQQEGHEKHAEQEPSKVPADRDEGDPDEQQRGDHDLGPQPAL